MESQSLKIVVGGDRTKRKSGFDFSVVLSDDGFVVECKLIKYKCQQIYTAKCSPDGEIKSDELALRTEWSLDKDYLEKYFMKKNELSSFAFEILSSVLKGQGFENLTKDLVGDKKKICEITKVEIELCAPTKLENGQTVNKVGYSIEKDFFNRSFNVERTRINSISMQNNNRTKLMYKASDLFDGEISISELKKRFASFIQSLVYNHFISSSDLAKVTREIYLKQGQPGEN